IGFLLVVVCQGIACGSTQYYSGPSIQSLSLAEAQNLLGKPVILPAYLPDGEISQPTVSFYRDGRELSADYRRRLDDVGEAAPAITIHETTVTSMPAETTSAKD